MTNMRSIAISIFWALIPLLVAAGVDVMVGNLQIASARSFALGLELVWLSLLADVLLAAALLVCADQALLRRRAPSRLAGIVWIVIGLGVALYVPLRLSGLPLPALRGGWLNPGTHIPFAGIFLATAGFLRRFWPGVFR